MRYLGELLVEAVDEARQYVRRVADLLRVLADDPDERGARVGFVQLVDALAERRYDALVARVLPEDVLDHHDGLLHHVVHLAADEVQQRVDALLRRRLDLDGHLPDGAHRAAHKVHVHLHGVLLELGEQLLVVALAGDADHDLDLGELEVGRVVVLAEEDADLFAEDVGLALQEEVDVTEGHVLDFGGGGDECYYIN